MSALNSWMSRVETYLTYRRCHGFKLTADETQLRSFARFADEIGTDGRLTMAFAVAWARSSRHQNQLTWARRITVLQGFARFCLRNDPATEILPQDLFGPTHRRRIPHIYTEAELATLLQAAKNLATGDLPMCLRSTGCNRTASYRWNRASSLARW